MKILVLFFLLPITFLGQNVISGTILENNTKNPIPYTSIGIVGKSQGTLSNEGGKFEFLILPENAKDSIRFWAIGFKPLTFLAKDLLEKPRKVIELENLPNLLEEVIVKSKKVKHATLGTTKYSQNNCTGFVKNSSNWIGSETAIKAGNKDGRQVWIESFSFFVIQNKYADSLKFRLMFYEASEKGYPRRKTILKKPIIFNVGTKQGEFSLDLKAFNITTSKDFFISLECLTEEVDISKFCYAGSYSVASFVKPSAFAGWTKVRGGGADFNVKISYVK